MTERREARRRVRERRAYRTDEDYGDWEPEEGGETFALGYRQADVAAWCQPLHAPKRHVRTTGVAHPEWGQYFLCLNGAWQGWFDGTHVRLDCADPGEPIPAVEVWRGVIPRSTGVREAFRDYNEAMEWIKTQVA